MFKKGDRVKCINNDGRPELEVGNIYTVRRIVFSSLNRTHLCGSGISLEEIDEKVYDNIFSSLRFTLVEMEMEEEKMGNILQDVKITVTDVGGTYRDVADAARTTIGLTEGTKEITESYMHKMYKCEHSPIRLREFKIVIENCPSWVATHFARHHDGCEKFISTQRTDRTGIDRNKLPQDAPVRIQMNCNSQAMINISRKRLCSCASKETREIWREVIRQLIYIDFPLYRCCVPECVYRGHCPEFKGCGYNKTYDFLKKLEKYQN